MTLIRDINNILEYGRKMTSYKYATLLAVFDFITEHPSEQTINNLHFIPIVYLARQFISYYYPFSFHNYYQGSLAADKSLKVLNFIDKFKLKAPSREICKNSGITGYSKTNKAALIKKIKEKMSSVTKDSGELTQQVKAEFETFGQFKNSRMERKI